MSFIPTVTSTCRYRASQGNHQKTAPLSPVAVCLQQTTLFSALQWLSCKPLLTWLFSFSHCRLSVSQGYGFQPSYDGDELSCTVRSLHRSTKFKFRVRKQRWDVLQSKLLIHGFNLNRSLVCMCRGGRLQPGRVQMPTVALWLIHVQDCVNRVVGNWQEGSVLNIYTFFLDWLRVLCLFFFSNISFFNTAYIRNKIQLVLRALLVPLVFE